MQEPQHYDDLVRRLSAYGYDVEPDPPGYIVQHRINMGDRSRARHFDDLVDLTELMEWAARHAQQSHLIES